MDRGTFIIYIHVQVKFENLNYNRDSTHKVKANKKKLELPLYA